MKALTTVSRTEAISKKRTVWKRFECATNAQNTKYISRRSRRFTQESRHLFPADRADLRRSHGIVSRRSRRFTQGSRNLFPADRADLRRKNAALFYLEDRF